MTELAHDGDRAARDVVALIGMRLGVGIANLVNVFNPEVVVDRRRRDRARATCCSSRRATVVRERALRAVARRVRDRRRAVRRGVGDARRGAAGARRAGLRRARGGGMSAGRLVVCPTPIGNLEDVTLRVLAALRDADVVACEDTRRTRVLLDRYGVQRVARLLPRAQRARAGGGARRRGCAAGDGRRARVRRGDAAGERPGLRARARRRSRRGWRSRCCRGRARRWPRWWRARCRRRRGASSGSCRASAAELAAVLALARDASWRSSRRGGSAASLAVAGGGRRRRGRSRSAAS